MTSNVHDAWTTFWERDALHRKSGRRRDPEGWKGIGAVQTGVWQTFARRLDKGVRVLDIATGDGRVLGDIQSARRDLKLVGTDRAAALPEGPRGVRLRGGVRMEKLPFPDTRFAAVTSQFGFEYGDMPVIAKEIARVLRPGGTVAIMSHRLDGPIVAHNRARLAQIAWAIEEQDLPEIARRNQRLREMGVAALPPEIASAPERGAQAFGPQSAAWEIAEAIRQSIVMGRQDAPQNVIALIDDIVAQAMNERGRIASLEIAARAADNGEGVVRALMQAGLTIGQREQLRDPHSGQFFADFIKATLPK
ncbi:class I SAM-dependent methyltransferase [Aurantiacibacter spongiae]|nr:class I SAM-dependent methyltransferase [Aurantiacibacter spongiae]